MKTCHHCGREVVLLAKLQRTDGCAGCHSDLKCCLNCRFFDTGANNQCREPAAEWCPEKEKANFCEFFEFHELSAGDRSGARATPPATSAKAAFKGLFKK